MAYRPTAQTGGAWNAVPANWVAAAPAATANLRSYFAVRERVTIRDNTGTVISQVITPWRIEASVDIEVVYILSATEPDLDGVQPAWGVAPAMWSFTKPDATATQDVYSATRRRSDGLIGEYAIELVEEREEDDGGTTPPPPPMANALTAMISQLMGEAATTYIATVGGTATGGISHWWKIYTSLRVVGEVRGPWYYLIRDRLVVDPHNYYHEGPVIDVVTRGKYLTVANAEGVFPAVGPGELLATFDFDIDFPSIPDFDSTYTLTISNLTGTHTDGATFTFHPIGPVYLTGGGSSLVVGDNQVTIGPNPRPGGSDTFPTGFYVIGRSPAGVTRRKYKQIEQKRDLSDLTATIYGPDKVGVPNTSRPYGAPRIALVVEGGDAASYGKDVNYFAVMDGRTVDLGVIPGFSDIPPYNVLTLQAWGPTVNEMASHGVKEFNVYAVSGDRSKLVASGSFEFTAPGSLYFGVPIANLQRTRSGARVSLSNIVGYITQDTPIFTWTTNVGTLGTASDNGRNSGSGFAHTTATNTLTAPVVTETTYARVRCTATTANGESTYIDHLVVITP